MNETPQLSELANEITRLEASLKTKKREYTRLKNSVAPIAILPNELLASIFEAGCNTTDPWVTPSSPFHAVRSKLLNARGSLQGPPFEILVSQVTRHWRNVAHQTPNLWTRVTLNTRTQHYLGVGADYIARSGALPLDLRIDLTFVRGLSRPLPIKSICHLICPEAVRWGQLRMRSDWYTGLQYIFDKMPSHAPMLRYVDLCYDNPTVSPPDDPPLPKRILTGGVSPLTRMVLKGVTLRCHFPPLAALQSLECHFMTLNSAHHMVHDMFAHLTRLTRLVLNDIDFDWAGAVDGFELPALTALYLRNIPDYDEVLAVISAPALHTLYLNTVDSNEMLRFPEALALPESGAPKFPRLRALFIKPVMYEDFSVAPDSWRALALITPAVTHFGLLHESVDEFLLALARTHAEPAGLEAFVQSGEFSHSDSASSAAPAALPIAWPELHTVSFPEASWTSLLDDILSARAAAHCPIRRVQASREIMAWLGPAADVWRGVVDIVECDPRTSAECRELGELYPVQWHDEGGEGESSFDDGDGDDISDFTDLSSGE
ncbi:hypothetical protein FIBSPDRAFT_935060 [Athelia psychrophila]|uniref:Uncharacterized protein n=1 Tax=Athelia psychrophila TaxID=1759441 RepID=A0A166ED23_9AGAM|nr:hypothetical protein FIBSPDRAFT_935060 [Fibularhizoctonia sp. CBS 109695]